MFTVNQHCLPPFGSEYFWVMKFPSAPKQQSKSKFWHSKSHRMNQLHGTGGVHESDRKWLVSWLISPI